MTNKNLILLDSSIFAQEISLENLGQYFDLKMGNFLLHLHLFYCIL